jgi:hypothetical protein
MIDHPGGMQEAGAVAQRSEAEARAAAVEALELVERGERNSLDNLRDAICAYLVVLKAEGASKDQALEKVRELIATPASADTTWLLPAAREALTELATHWCTQQYL